MIETIIHVYRNYSMSVFYCILHVCQSVSKFKKDSTLEETFLSNQDKSKTLEILFEILKTTATLLGHWLIIRDLVFVP